VIDFAMHRSLIDANADARAVPHPLEGVDGWPQPSKTAEKTPVSILQLLDWAFRRECASIDFEDSFVPASYGMEVVIAQRAELFDEDHPGHLDGGGRSEPHVDAEIVAAAVAVLPEARGGRRMALMIVDLAKSQSVPDCMLNAKPRIEPVEWRSSPHGRYAMTEIVGSYERTVRGRKRQEPIKACPIRYSVSASEIAAARRRYLEWRGALMHLHSVLSYDHLCCWELTRHLPPLKPWEKQLTKS